MAGQESAMQRKVRFYVWNENSPVCPSGGASAARGILYSDKMKERRKNNTKI
ncbi:MAG: hypothetical protein Q4E89_05480 [Eubacteriales bacterium]|nr:hypothetical protein [Eubacteriales bacterium]